jgi:2-oxoglutarate ferredoxin oxidoreductase subunit delta
VTAVANTADEKTAAADVALPPVALDLDLCKACGICIDLCPEDVFDRDKLAYPVLARAEDCTSCLLCELHCPDFAIEVRRRPRKTPAKGAAATPEAIAAAESDRVKAALAGQRREAEHPAAGSECGIHGGED